MSLPNLITGTGGLPQTSAPPTYLLGWSGSQWVPVLVDSSGRIIGGGTPSGVSDQVVGNVASDDVDAGNPVKIGGKANTTLPSPVASGDRVDAYFTAYGQLGVSPLVTTQPADGDTAYRQGSLTGSGIGAAAGLLYNGANWDRQRNNVAASYLASAARTATPTSPDITTYNARGIRVSINVTAITASPSVVPSIEVKDAVSGVYTAILTGAAIVGTGHVELVVMPGITPVANIAAAMALARTMRVSMTHGDADSITYSVAVELLV